MAPYGLKEKRKVLTDLAKMFSEVEAGTYSVIDKTTPPHLGAAVAGPIFSSSISGSISIANTVVSGYIDIMLPNMYATHRLQIPTYASYGT